MTERKRNPEEILEEMLKKHTLFETLEKVAVVAAGAGTILVGVAKQSAVLAAAPLTIALALNYFNRTRLRHINRYQAYAEVTEVQRRLSSEIQGLRGQSFEGSDIVGTPDTSQFQELLASFADRIAALEHQGGSSSGDDNTTQLQDELVQLRNHQLDLSQSLEAVNQHLRSMPADAPSTSFEYDIAELKAYVAQLQSAPMAATSGNFESAPFDPTHLEQNIAALKAQVDQLHSVSMEAGATPQTGNDLETLRYEVQGLMDPMQRHLADLESRWAQVYETSTVAAQAPMDVEPLRAEFAQMMTPVQQQMMSLEERLAAQSSVSSNNEPTVHPDELNALYGQMGSLNEKLESVVSQLSAEIAGFQQSVEHTQGQVQAVHQQVQSVHENVSAAPAGLSPDVLHQEMQAVVGPLHEQVAALEHRLSSMPTVDSGVSQVHAEQMISLQNQLNNTNGFIEEVSAQLKNQFAAEFSKIPQLVDEKLEHKVSMLQPAQPVVAVAPQDTKKDAFSELDAILADINL